MTDASLPHNLNQLTHEINHIFPKLANVIVFSLFKGGVGKSTACSAIAAALAVLGFRVLVVDTDENATSTKYAGLNPDLIAPNIYHLFAQKAAPDQPKIDPHQAVHPGQHGYDVLPTSKFVSAVEAAMELNEDEWLLKDIIEPLRVEYDYILIDPPPGKRMLSFNALFAAQWIFACVSAERASIDGLTDLTHYVTNTMWNVDEDGDQEVKKMSSAQIKAEGFHRRKRQLKKEQEIRIFFTKVRRDNLHSPGIVNTVKKVWGSNVLPIEIAESIEFSRSYDKAIPITIFKPGHWTAKKYVELADWISQNVKPIKADTQASKE